MADDAVRHHRSAVADDVEFSIVLPFVRLTNEYSSFFQGFVLMTYILLMRSTWFLFVFRKVIFVLCVCLVIIGIVYQAVLRSRVLLAPITYHFVRSLLLQENDRIVS